MSNGLNTPRSKFGTERQKRNTSKVSDDEYKRKFKKLKLEIGSNLNEESRLSPLKLCTPDNKQREFCTKAKTTRRNTRTAKVLSVAKEDALGMPCNSYSFDEKF